MIVWDVERRERRRDARGPRRARSPGWRSAGSTLYTQRPATARSSSGTSPAPAASAARSRSAPDNPESPRYALSPDGRDLAIGQRRRDRRADRRPHPAEALALPGGPRRAGPRHGVRAPAASCSSSAATTASSRWSTRGAAGSSSACPASAARSTRPASAPTDGSWPRAASTGSCSTRCRRDDPVGRPYIGSTADHGRVAQPRRPHAGRHATPRTAASRSATCPRSGSARRCPTPRRCGTTRASRPTGASSWARAGRAGRSCGPPRRGSPSAAGSPGTPAAWNGSRSAPTADTLATGGPDGNDPPVGPAHAAAARRSAARPAEPHRSSRSSRPTARTCSRSTATAGAPTAGTCARPRGRGTPARSPGGTLTRAEWQDALGASVRARRAEARRSGIRQAPLSADTTAP